MTLLLLGAGASSAGSGLTVIPGNPLLQRLLDDTQSGDQIGYESLIGRTVVYDHSTNAAFRELRAGRGYKGGGGSDFVTLPESLAEAMESLSAFTLVMVYDRYAADQEVTVQIGANGNERIAIQLRGGSIVYGVCSASGTNRYGTWTGNDGAVGRNSLTLTFDGSGATNADKLKLYKNGSQVTFNSFTSTIPTTTSSAMTGGVDGYLLKIIGDASWQNGQILEAAVYSDILTAEEITAVHDSSSYPTDSLEALYWCDEEAGDIAFDSSGNGRHGTINGTLTDIHQANTEATYNSANSLGHSVGVHIDPTDAGTWPADNHCLFTGEKTGDYDMSFVWLGGGTSVFVGAFKTDTPTTNSYSGIYAEKIVRVSGGELNVYPDNDTTSGANVASGSVIRFTRIGTAGTIYVDGVSVYTWTSSLPSVWAGASTNGSGKQALCIDNDGPVTVLEAGADCNEATVIIPRDEADTSNDVYGNSLHYTGRAQHYAVAKGGACITGDGVADRFGDVHGGTAPSLSANTQAFWLKINEADKGLNAYLAVFESWLDSGVADGRFIRIDMNPGNNTEVSAYVYDGVSNSFGTTDIGLDTWAHCCLTYTDGAQVFYINGKQVATASYTATNLAGATGPYLMARPGSSAYSEVSMRDVRLYGRVLTAAEVLWLATGGDQGTDPTETDLEAHYSCSERFGDVLHDVSGNERHLIANGTLADIWANTHTGRQWNLENGHTPACWLWTNNSSSFQIAPATNIAMPSSGRIVCEVAPIDDSMNNNAIIGWTLSGGYFYVFVDPGDEWTVYTNLTPILPGSSGVAVEYGKTVTIDLQWTTGAGGNVTMTVDGVEAINVDGTLNISTATTLTLGYYTSNSWGSGLYRRIRYYDTDKTTVLHDWRPYYPGQTVLKDLVGSNDLVPAGTEGTHWRFMEIPGNTGVEPDGSTATYFLGANTSGKHAPPSDIDAAILDLTGGVSTPLANSINLETGYKIADDRESVAPADTKFRRTENTGDDRFLSYKEAIT